MFLKNNKYHFYRNIVILYYISLILTAPLKINSDQLLVLEVIYLVFKSFLVVFKAFYV